MVLLKKFATLECKQQSVRAIRFNVDGSYCLSCGADKKVQLWNPHRQLWLKTYSGHADEVLDAASYFDSSHFISGSKDKSVILWDVTTGQPIRRYRGQAGSVTCVKLNEFSTMAVSGSVDNSVAFWDVGSRRQMPVQVLKEAKDAITSLVVTDTEVISTSVDCHVRCYDIRVGKMTSDFMGHIVTFGSILPDGSCYVLSCNDDTVKLIDRESGECLSVYKGHCSNDYLLENAVNSKGSRILTGSAVGEVICWDLESGGVIYKCVHDSCPVVSLSYHPTKNYLLTACEDKVRVWGPELTMPDPYEDDEESSSSGSA